jgi:MFS family permease
LSSPTNLQSPAIRMDGQADGHKTRDRRNITLAVVLCAQLMIVLDMTVVNIALPSMATGLHLTATSLSWVLNAYALTFGGLLLLGGRAGDILGRRQAFMAGLVIFTVASLAGGLATSSGSPPAPSRASAGRSPRQRCWPPSWRDSLKDGNESARSASSPR